MQSSCGMCCLFHPDWKRRMIAYSLLLISNCLFVCLFVSIWLFMSLSLSVLCCCEKLSGVSAEAERARQQVVTSNQQDTRQPSEYSCHQQGDNKHTHIHNVNNPIYFFWLKGKQIFSAIFKCFLLRIDHFVQLCVLASIKIELRLSVCRICVCVCVRQSLTVGFLFSRVVSRLQSAIANVPRNLSPIKDPDRLLQDVDINRLRAVVFRDVVRYLCVWLMDS